MDNGLTVNGVTLEEYVQPFVYPPSRRNHYGPALRRDVIPALGCRPLGKITADELVRVLEDIRTRKGRPCAAKALSGLRFLFRTAVAAGAIKENRALLIANDPRSGGWRWIVVRRPPATPAGGRPAVSADMTLASYVQHWWSSTRHRYRQGTLDNYRSMLEVRILPALGEMPLSALNRRVIRAFLVTMLDDGQAVNTIRTARTVLSAILTSAVEDDELLAGNAAHRAERRLWSKQRAEPKAPDAAEVALILETARRITPRLYPFFFLLSRTALRIGELLGLQAPDCDLEARRLAVGRTWHGGAAGDGVVKNGRGRPVDLSQQAVEALRPLVAAAVAPHFWLFPGRSGHKPRSKWRVQSEFARVLAVAGRPGAWTPHSFRHGCASQLISAGVSPAFVQRLLGHSNISTTIQIYGSGLPFRDLAAVDRLDGVTP